MNNILTVSALTEQLRKSLESRFPFVWVRGEVTNLSKPASGHMYFSLKDSRAQLQCVWFAGKQAGGDKFDPLTGEVYATPRPKPADLIRNGLEVLCAGSLGIYAARGQYQLLVDFVEQAGAGALAQAFEERKARLAALGYFAMERKRALPENPRRIALITSPGGAAIHDFLELASNRGLSSRIRIFPVAVQGDGAAPEIIQAINCANAQDWAEVIVIARGGGSLEDLWAFNDESLAGAIFNSRVPVLAGIGHEVDFTLADLTADLRAATPSHAAQLLWPLRSELMQKADEMDMRLGQGIAVLVQRAQNQLDQKINALGLLSPAARLRRLGNRNRELSAQLHKEAQRLLSARLARLEYLDGSRKKAGGLARMCGLRQQKLAWLDERLPLCLERIFARTQKDLENLHARVDWLLKKFFADLAAKLEMREAALQAHDPVAPLRRGYALIYAGDRLLNSVAGLAPGQEISARLADGVINATVESTKEIADEEWNK